MFSFPRDRLPRVGPLPRRLLAAACLLLAALTAVAGRRPAAAAGSTRTVVTAARALAVGHVIARGDLVERHYPNALAPAGVAGHPAELVGRRVAAPVARGEPMGLARTVGHDLADGLGPGTVASVVVLAGRHAADLVRPGDRVDVLATTVGSDDAPVGSGGDGATAVVASDVRVLAVFPASDDPGSVSDGLGDAGPELVVASTAEIAIRLTRTSSSHIFTVFARAP